IGTPGGLEVSLTASPESDWFAVDFGTNKPLALWLRNELSQLNVRRMQLLRTGLSAYCRDKLIQIRGEKIAINALAVRDHVGINACTSALGSVLVCSAGQLQIPCSYEDTKGAVYFCLPAGTLAFQIEGKTSPEGVRLFPGQFTAIVAPEAAPVPATVPAENDGATGEPDEKADAAGMTSEGDGNMKDSQDVPPDKSASESKADHMKMSDEKQM
ncbi:MAG: hypothetical protein ACK58L_15885, partial [Planctomycetota bacterium]